VPGTCEHNNELSYSVEGGKFLEWLSELLKRNSAPRRERVNEVHILCHVHFLAQ
jgi:hypothetical protein